MDDRELIAILESCAEAGSAGTNAFFGQAASAVRQLCAERDELREALSREPAIVSVLRELRIDANRLCDRNQGGTYEDDCRRSVAKADAALRALAEEIHAIVRAAGPIYEYDEARVERLLNARDE